MASDDESLVLSISADTRQILRAIKRLEGDIGKSASSIEKSFSGIGRGIDKSIDTTVQKRINEITGVGVKATKEWTGALAEQGKEMERMRARFNPIFSVVTRYKATVSEIQTAQRLGAISADEMTAAIQRERQAALASIAALKQRNAALGDARTMRVGSFNTANIAAQFQDIGVTAAMGMSPLQIALQQGTQLSLVFEQLKRDGQGVGRSLAAAFGSIISPVSLVTIGLTAAVAAAVQYFGTSESGIEKLNKIIEEHRKIIASLGPEYEAAAKMAEDSATESAQVVDALLSENLKKAREQLRTEIDNAALAIKIMGARGDADFAPFAGLIADLKEGTIEVLEFRKRVADIALANPALAALRDLLFAATKNAADATIQISGMADEADRVALSASNMARALGQMSSGAVKKELEEIGKEAASGELSLKRLQERLDGLSGVHPDMSGAIAEFGDLAKAAIAARDAIGQVTLAQGLAGQFSPDAGVKGGRVSSPTPEEVKRRMARLAGDYANALQMWRRFGYDDDSRVDPNKPKKAPRTRVPRRTADDRFFEDIEAIQQRTRALAEEKAMIGQTFEEQTKRRVAFDLETQALKQVREEARRKGDQDWQNAQLTPEQVRQIDDASAAYARQAEELRKAHEEMAFRRDVLKGLFGDIRNAFEDGKITAREWGDIVINVLDKIIDKIEDDLIDAILQANSAGKGGGGGILGAIGSLFGGGGGGGFTAFEQAFTQLPGLWADGTANTGGRRGEPRGIVHGQEAVIPLPSGGKVPVQITGPQVPALPRAYNDNGPAASITYAPSYTIHSEDGDPRKIVAAIEQYDKGRLGRLKKDLPELRRRSGTF